MKHKEEFLRGTLIGLLVGLVGGILLAPASGEETRKKLRRRAERLAGDATDRIESLSEGIGQRVGELKRVAQDLSVEAREESKQLIARAEVLKRDLQNSTSTLRQAGRGAREEAVGQVRFLMDEGATVMDELESLTKRLVGSAKTKLRRRPDDQSDRVGEEANPKTRSSD